MIDEGIQNHSRSLLADSDSMLLNGSVCKCAELKGSSKAFTLVEILIVVAILGILAAIVMPEFQNHIQKAKESSAKDNLRILRNAIEVYAVNHMDVPPGYPNDDRTRTPNFMVMGRGLTDINHYLSDIPENPFNDSWQIKVLADDEVFPTTAEHTDLYGWIYQPKTKEIRLNWSGTDSDGNTYFSY